MQKSKVERIDEIRNWDGPKGTIMYHSLVMENGDKIDIGKKKELAIGEELTYEIVEAKGNYHKAKTINENFQGGGFKGKGADQDAILYQVCLKEASNIVAFDGWNGNEDTKDKCKYITDLAYQIAVVSKENINKLKNK